MTYYSWKLNEILSKQICASKLLFIHVKERGRNIIVLSAQLTNYLVASQQI